MMSLWWEEAGGTASSGRSEEHPADISLTSFSLALFTCSCRLSITAFFYKTKAKPSTKDVFTVSPMEERSQFKSISPILAGDLKVLRRHLLEVKRDDAYKGFSTIN